MEKELELLKAKIPYLNRFNSIKKLYNQTDNKHNKYFLKCDNNYLSIVFGRKKIKSLLKIYRFLNKNGFSYLPEVLWTNTLKTILITTLPGNGNGKSLEEIEKFNISINDDITAKVYDLISKLHQINLPKKYINVNYFNIIKKEFDNYLKFFLKKQLLSSEYCNKIIKLFLNLKQYFIKVKQTYIHDDFTGKNICYDTKNKHVYLIDWDTLKIGDPNIDFSKIVTHKCTYLLDAFVNKHCSNIEPKVIRIYHIRTYLFWLKFLYKNKNSYFQKGIKDFELLINSYYKKDVIC